MEPKINPTEFKTNPENEKDFRLIYEDCSDVEVDV